jgi:hypothetical protein
MLSGYYINLEKRTDRKKHFESLKQKYAFLSNIQRFNAIANNNGAIGCSMSHVKCLNNC